MFSRKTRTSCITVKNTNDILNDKIRRILQPILVMKLILGDDKFFYDGSYKKNNVLYKIYTLILFIPVFLSFSKEVVDTKSVGNLIWNGCMVFEITFVSLNKIFEYKKGHTDFWLKLNEIYNKIDNKDVVIANEIARMKRNYLILFYMYIIIQFYVYSSFLLMNNTSLDMLIFGLILHTQIDVEYMWRATVYFMIYLYLKLLRIELNIIKKTSDTVEIKDANFVKIQKMNLLKVYEIYEELICLTDISKCNKNMLVRFE